MPKLVTWMNNQRVGELTKLANGAHTFKYAPEWLASRYARPLSLSLPLQRGNITSDAVFNFFDNLLPDSPIARLYVTGSLNVIMPNPDNRLIYCQK
ncbi:protein hipA [Escherichia coli]|nr:protein hipA [Escherichia coli]